VAAARGPRKRGRPEEWPVAAAIAGGSNKQVAVPVSLPAAPGDTMTQRNRLIAFLLAMTGLAAPYASPVTANPARSVVELFTSQGCSSCPPADALAGRLRSDPSVVVLSFHVNYWDGPGWKDSFASQASTDRQYAYAQAFRERSVFTPQLIVNGTRSVVGSYEADVRKAIATASSTALPVTLELTRQSDEGFSLTLAGPALVADVWEFRYVRHAVIRPQGGENGGRALESFNDVLRLRRLGAFEPGVSRLPPLRQPEEGLAVIVQRPSGGPVLGVASY